MKNQENMMTKTANALETAKHQNITLSQFLAMPSPSKAITEALGERKHQFIASMVALAKRDPKLNECTKESLLGCGLAAASLDLPLNQSLGFAYAIPFKNKELEILEAQFQIGWKGFVQLAQRSGQVETINVSDVREGQLISENKLTGELFFDWSIKSSKVAGYVAYFRLLNGFRKALYMSVEKLREHGRKYSRTFSFGHWSTNFDAMAQKTCLKQLISRWCPLSTQLEKAVIFDQAVIKNGEPYYVDSASISPTRLGEEKNKEWEQEVKEILEKEN